MTTDVPVVRRRMTSRELGSGGRCSTRPPSCGGFWAPSCSGVEPLAGRLPVLLALSEADGTRGCGRRELAASIDWERSRLSHHLGRMERRGLIRRDECATDNRGADGLAHRRRGGHVPARDGAPHAGDQGHFADALTPEQFDGARRDPADAAGSAGTSHRESGRS